MTTAPHLLAAMLAIAVAAVAIALTQPAATRDRILLFAIGASAALVNIQVANVHAFTILVIGWAILCHSNRQSVVTGPMLTLVLSVGLVASSIIAGDLVANPRLAIQMLLLATSAFLLAMYTRRSELFIVLKGTLAMIVISASYGVGQLIGVVPTREHTHLDISTIGRPNGLWPEADWLGMFCAIGVVLAWKLRLSWWQRTIALPICGSMWILSFARAAWIALAVTLIAAAVAGIMHRQRPVTNRRPGRGLAAVVTGLAVAAPIYFLPAIADDLVYRLGRTLSVQDDDVSGAARLQQAEALNYLAETAPWHGHGLSAAGRVGVSGKLYLEGSYHNSVASNWVLGLWVDAQLLAIPFIVLVVGLTLVSIRHIGGQVLAVVIINSFFTNATFVPIFWLALSICLAALWRREPQHRQVSNTVRSRNVSNPRANNLVNNLRKRPQPVLR